MDLEKLKHEIFEFSNERDWDQFHSLKNLAMALAVESSELLEIFQWMSEADSNNIHNDPKKNVALRDEVADVFIYLLRISTKAKINLEEAVLEKMKKNALKYPTDLSRGNSKKYDELEDKKSN